MKKIAILLIIFVSFSMLVFADRYRSLSGESMGYYEMISNPKTVLFIWTSWCPSCISKMNELNKNHDIPDDVKVYFVNIGDSASTVKGAVTRLQLNEKMKANILMDPDYQLADRFNIAGVPMVLFFKDKRAIEASYDLSKDQVKRIYQKLAIEETNDARDK
ncbi:MAG: TlpA family protein disulfide reductase [Candidatus Omnitrophica bacterium]|nr:TlpA family protein disulfide reductase [Candidatus Omnitrophota bacterium]